MNLLTQLKQSLQPKDYPNLLKLSVTSSIRYFLSISILLASFIVLFGLIPFAGQTSRVVSSFINSNVAEDLFPSDLVVTLENHKISTNQTSPVVIPFPKEYVGDTPNLLVIDPYGTIDSFRSYQSLILITQDSLVAEEDDGELRAISFEKLSAQKIEVDRNDWNSALIKIKKYTSIAIPILFVVALLGGVLGLTFVFCLMLFGYSLVSYILSRLIRTGLPFKKSIQVACYALPLFLISDSAMDLFGKYNLFSFPYLKLTLFISLVVYIFFHYKRQHHQSKPLQKWLIILVALVYLLLVVRGVVNFFKKDSEEPAQPASSVVTPTTSPSPTPSATPTLSITKAVSPTPKKNNCSQFVPSKGPVFIKVILNSESGKVMGKTVIRIKPSGQCPGETALLEQWLESSERSWVSPGIAPGRYTIEAANGNYQGVVSRQVDLVEGGYELTINLP